MNTLIKFLGIFLIVGTCLYIAYLNYVNMDMTELRLFVTYWKQYIVCAISLFAGICLAIYGGLK